jgi:ribose transport system substrate-binding protein
VKEDKVKEARRRARTGALRRGRVPAAAAVVAALALGVALTSAEAKTGTARATIPASTLTSLKQMVTAAEAVPKWTAPGPAVSAASVKGASMTVFPVNSEIDACNTQTNDFVTLGKSLGANVKAESNSGNPAQWVTAIQSATAAHDKAIIMLCGVIPGAVGPQLTAAHKAGAKIVDGNYNETTNYGGLDGETNVNVIQGMQDDVADALVNLKGTPLHALLVTSSSIIQGPASISAVKGEIGKVCPSTCTEQTVDVPIQDWATATEGDVSSALVANSSINAVIIAFDGMTPFAMPAIEKHSGLKIYTWGGGRSVVKLMKASDPIVMADPAPDEQWDAYDAMDQVIRLLGGHPAASVNKEIDPNRFWTPSNVPQFFGPGGTYGNEGYGGNAFINDFLKLWGVK